MPNIPNTTIPGQTLYSTGFQNGSMWGPGPTSSLAQHQIYLGIATPHTGPTYSYQDVRSFAASGTGKIDAGVLTSAYCLPNAGGPGPYVACDISLFPPQWTNIDTTAGPVTINLQVSVTDSTNANGINVSMTATVARSGPGQSYTFSGTDFSGATVSTQGTNLSWNTGGYVNTVSTSIPYTSVLTWLVTF